MNTPNGGGATMRPLVSPDRTTTMGAPVSGTPTSAGAPTSSPTPALFSPSSGVTGPQTGQASAVGNSTLASKRGGGGSATTGTQGVSSTDPYTRLTGSPRPQPTAPLFSGVKVNRPPAVGPTTINPTMSNEAFDSRFYENKAKMEGGLNYQTYVDQGHAPEKAYRLANQDTIDLLSATNS